MATLMRQFQRYQEFTKRYKEFMAKWILGMEAERERLHKEIVQLEIQLLRGLETSNA